MIIMVINTGSSSIKYQLIEMDHERVLIKGALECIGMDISTHTIIDENLNKTISKAIIMNHRDGMQAIINMLTGGCLQNIPCINEISAVGHRVAHGGERLTDSSLITDEVIGTIGKVNALAPIHNPPILMAIKACREILPHVPMVAVFDTAYHKTIPEYAYIYPIPYDLYTKYGIRRYGFHGTSHRFVAQRASEHMGKPLNTLKMITCHLGNGSSITAICNGLSIDTSMGFTPLEGIPMGTRSGTIDPSIIPFLMEKERMTSAEINKLLNNNSGLQGISGISSDLRIITAAAEQGDSRAKLALEILSYSIKKFIGSYCAIMDGIDCLVFTGGIGENSALIRGKSCQELGFFGLRINAGKNIAENGGTKLVQDISADDSIVKILVIPTNEELAIARETQAVLQQEVAHKCQPLASYSKLEHMAGTNHNN